MSKENIKDCWKCKGEGRLPSNKKSEDGFIIQEYDECPICLGRGELKYHIPQGESKQK